MTKLRLKLVAVTKTALFSLLLAPLGHAASVLDCQSILTNYYSQDYAVFELNAGQDLLAVEKELVSLAETLNLGRIVFHPEAKSSPIFLGSGLNLITAGGMPEEKVALDADGKPIYAKRAFGSSYHQGLHRDGTLEEIDAVPTSLLYVVVAAPEGGESILFQAVKAFEEFRELDPEAAQALLNPRALVRTNLKGKTKIGPVFAEVNGEILSRYTEAPTGTWNFEEIPHLDRAYDWMHGAAQHGSPYFHVFRVEPGHGLLFANDKVAHGRRGFRNTADQKRLLIRGLFEGRPR